MKFEFFEVTADVGYRAYGKNLEEAFENAALAMFEVITDTSKIKPEKERIIDIESEDHGALLYDWLTELLFLHDSEYLIFSRFKVEIEKKDNLYHLKGTVWGEEFNSDVHEPRDEVKAVTYHLMDVKKKDGYMVQVILDI
ncbi:MAG: archease [Euryarchaeota archaeon]|nr:archease [Euryarchaeota archaeon]